MRVLGGAKPAERVPLAPEARNRPPEPVGTMPAKEKHDSLPRPLFPDAGTFGRGAENEDDGDRERPTRNRKNLTRDIRRDHLSHARA